MNTLRELIQATAREWRWRHTVWAALIGWLSTYDMGSMLFWAHDAAQLLRAWSYNALQFGVPYVFLLRLADRAIDAGVASTDAYMPVTLFVPPFGTWVAGPLLQPLFGGGEGWTRLDDLDLCISRILTFALATLLYVKWREQQRTLAQLSQAALARERVQQEVQTARLLALQARVDPEFLFATLGRVRTHIKEPGPGAEHLLGHLIALLRAMQPGDHLNASTLGRELQLLRAFGRTAEIETLRPGQMQHDVEPALHNALLAPLVLLPVLRGLASTAPQQRWTLLAAEFEARLRIVLRATEPVDPASAQALAQLDRRTLLERLVVKHGASAAIELVPGTLPSLRIDVPLSLTTDSRAVATPTQRPP